MRILWASLAAAATVLALATPALGGRQNFAVHGWAVQATAARAVAHPGKALKLAQLPLLTTYPWAQPKTAPQHVPYGQP